MLDATRAMAIIPSSDPTALRPFYEHTLGLVPRRVIDGAAVIYEAGEGTTFAISRTTGRASGTHTQMVFLVDDIARAVATLRGRGVTFETYETPRTVDGIAEMPSGLAAWFKDPDGNTLGLLQMTPDR